MSTATQTNPSEYLRGRTDLISLNEPVGMLLEHLLVRSIQRQTGRSLNLDARFKLRLDLADGLHRVAERERRQMRLALPANATTGHLGLSRVVGPPPDIPLVIPGDEAGQAALAALRYEEDEHTLRADIASEQWS